MPPVPPVAESLTSSETAAYQVSPTNGTAGSNGHRHNAHASSPVDRHPEPPALVDLAEVERFLIDFVVDQTGYPPEIVELDAELEADLGIDSIKKAQLFGEIREQFAPQAAPNADGASAERNTLGQFRCLRDVLDWVGQELKAPPESPPASTSRSPAPVTSSPYSSPPAAMAESVTDLDRVAVPSSDPMRQCDTSSDNADTPVAVRSSLVSPHFVASEAVPRGTVEELAMRAKLRKQMARMLERRRHWPTDALDRLAPTEMLAMLSPATLRELIGQSERTGLHLGSLVANYLHETSSGNDPADTFALDNDVCSKGNGNARRTKDSENAHHEADNGRAAGNGDVARASHHNQVTSRYLLTVEPSPPSDAGVQTPSWNGACIILGDNPLVSVLRQRIEQTGGRAHWIRPTASPATAIAELERIWQTEPALHVFLTTPHDDDAMTSFHAEDWQRRRGPAIESPFWFCQRWYQLVKDAKLMDDASLVGFTRLGGDFGFSGNVTSAESGAITGMLKAIIIESWVAGHRTIPIKLIDSPGNEPADSIVSAAFRELAQPSYDVEISCRGGERAVVRAVESPLGSSHAPTHTLPHGTWVFTGGARGITAYVAEQLALRYSLSLQLIGTAPVPNVPEHWRDMTEEQRRREKLNVMQEARAKGDNPIKAWENAEKAIEIDATLRRLRSLGIEVQYHSCDVSDRTALAGVLQTIRQQNGPIRGVLHGAGVGKDSRFEHKRPDKVDQCIRAKVDGTLALMDLTREDPLDHFVAFGSISGRFGANGHADYSLANDTLAKLV
ncbi:MAG: SDR family NAD(P)-dependent oxidoreductase, partial [Planctomycetales bacterium]|nr:SDR family NAD(P)-dependent oxidoreductase [Planctomycetales bacterium]